MYNSKIIPVTCQEYGDKKTVFFAESVHFFSYFVSDAPFVPGKQKDAARRPIAQVDQRVAIRVTMTAADAKMEVTMIAVIFLYLFLFYFRGSLCPPRHPYNTTTRTKFVRVVKFDALFVIFEGDVIS